jgi:small subunit ribosomal protein S11
MTEELKQDANLTPTAESAVAASTDAVLDGAKKSATKTKKKVRKNVAVRQVASGRAYIKSTYNNTIVTLTDQNGNVLSWSSAGQCGFKGPKKATPYAASIIVKDATEKVKKYGLKEVSVFVRGIGGGREAAVRALNANGFNVVNIKDITPIPHNGCRPPRPRRV